LKGGVFRVSSSLWNRIRILSILGLFTKCQNIGRAKIKSNTLNMNKKLKMFSGCVRERIRNDTIWRESVSQQTFDDWSLSLSFSSNDNDFRLLPRNVCTNDITPNQSIIKWNPKILKTRSSEFDSNLVT
jgi:hypothetical protein